MNQLLHKMLLVYAAGCAGGLANSIVLWLFGLLGITGVLCVNMTPSLTPSWLYPRVVWGGLWGFLFLLPYLRSSCFIRGLLYSIGPSLVQLFIIFPLKLNKGLLGLDLGTLTPLFVLFFNAIWGWKAACLLTRVETK